MPLSWAPKRKVEIILLNTNPQLRQKPCWVEYRCEYYIGYIDPWISKYSGDHHHTGNPKYLRVFQLRDVETEWNSRGGYPLVKFNIAIKYPHVQEEIHLPTVDFPASYIGSYTGKIYHINWLLRGNYASTVSSHLGRWNGSLAPLTVYIVELRSRKWAVPAVTGWGQAPRKNTVYNKYPCHIIILSTST